MLNHAPTLAIRAVHTAENAPLKVWVDFFIVFNRVLTDDAQEAEPAAAEVTSWVLTCGPGRLTGGQRGRNRPISKKPISITRIGSKTPGL